MGPGTASDSCRSPSACSAERPSSAPFGMAEGLAGVSLPTSEAAAIEAGVSPRSSGAARYNGDGDGDGDRRGSYMGGAPKEAMKTKKAPAWARGLFGVGGPVEEEDFESELSDDRPKLWERAFELAVRYLWDSWSAPVWYTRFVQPAAGCIVLDPFVDLFIIICILLNTACLAAEDANSDKEQIDFLKAANKVQNIYYNCTHYP